MKEKKEKKQKQPPQWPTGVLTQQGIRKDVRKGGWLSAIVLTVGTAVLCAMAWPMIAQSSDVELKIVAVAAGAVILLVLAGRQWKAQLQTEYYRIEEDRVVGKEMLITYDDKDAERLNLPTRTPVLELEKHGSYRIDAQQIHDDYNAHQLYHLIEEGETVYVVYTQEKNKLVRIYRGKYWSLP